MSNLWAELWSAWNNAFLVWFWNVWNELFDTVESAKINWEEIPKQSIIGFANTTMKIVDRGSGRPLKERVSLRDDSSWSLEDIYEYLLTLKDSTTVLDTSNIKWRPLVDFYLNILKNTNHKISTANKNPLVECTFEEFNEITKDPNRINFEATVMAGYEEEDIESAVATLLKYRDAWIKVSGITASISWTNTFIPSEIQRNLLQVGRDNPEFQLPSDIIKSAAENWYAESNPLDDLDWFDVGRKMVILLRLAGHDIWIDDINIVPIIEREQYEWLKDGKLFDALKNEDERLIRSFSTAIRDNLTIRYVAMARLDNDDNMHAVAQPELVPLDGVIWQLEWTTNYIQIVTEQTEDQHVFQWTSWGSFVNQMIPWEPYSITWPWAGTDITSDTVIRGWKRMG